jgi:hypothetical protein
VADFLQGRRLAATLKVRTDKGEDVGLAAGEVKSHGVHLFTFFGENKERQMIRLTNLDSLQIINDLPASPNCRVAD